MWLIACPDETFDESQYTFVKMIDTPDSYDGLDPKYRGERCEVIQNNIDETKTTNVSKKYQETS